MNESRRMLLKSVLIGVAAGTVPATAWGALWTGRGETGPRSAPDGGAGEAAAGTGSYAPPWSLLAPVSVGTALALGWRVESLSPIRHGASVLTLRHGSGEEARLHVCRNGGSPVGIAHTNWLDLILVNRGDGRRPTSEPIGCVVLGLAETLRRREAGSPSIEPAVASLKTNAERLTLLSRGAHA